MAPLMDRLRASPRTRVVAREWGGAMPATATVATPPGWGG